MRPTERVISFSTQTLSDAGMKDVAELNTGVGDIVQTPVWVSGLHLVCTTSVASFSAPFEPLVSSAEVQSEQHDGAVLCC